jgi:capsular exopolysaccharide synthesis family protein
VLDNRIKTPDAIKVQLELPVLGWAPLLSKRSLRGRAPLLNNKVPAELAEAFGIIRSNLRFSLGEQQRQMLVVTSAAPSEGKTVVAANLAIGFARAGLRVLLIDADLRKPSMHSLFEQPREPGLTDVIHGTTKITDAARLCGIPNLWVLPAGTHDSNPAECLESRQFQTLLKVLREHAQFDRIVIDTPPVLPVADACLVAHAATAVIFVIGSNLTSRDAARAALDQLSTAGPQFLGAVLNRVDVSRNPYSDWTRYRQDYIEYPESDLTPSEHRMYRSSSTPI